MEIEYIYPDNNDKQREEQMRRLERENTIGCLVMGLFLLIGAFVFLSLLPFFLIVLGYSILGLGIYIIYKAYLEDTVLNFIQKIKSHH